MVHRMITISASSLLSTIRIAALAPALYLGSPADLAAQGKSVIQGKNAVQGTHSVYERRDECVEAGLLSAEQCEFAYRNARAEFEQKAPRYASRASCEQVHKRCGAQLVATGGWDTLGRGGATYVPRFSGVRLTGEGAALRALPVVEGSGRIAFAGRSVTELQDKVAGRQNVSGPTEARSSRRGHPTQASGPYVKRGDRDDTVRVPMEQKSIGSNVAPGLYVDPDGVEWYKPARRH
ncbi:Uncharacterized conserved protein YgiB, involved in bioifilm formation, UPF0441/DUF1190 family [Bosea sp. OK403]|nr:Uncharacterized conserved protein YgiB, involved in bioifilm formation, UPF0441/DUF1190 family [Bosea sp. OK403]